MAIEIIIDIINNNNKNFNNKILDSSRYRVETLWSLE